MKSRLTKDLKVQFLGIIPYLEDKTGVLTPQQIVSLSALLTFKGKPIKTLLKESVEKGENIKEKIQNILRRSSLRGHASIATTPSICLAYEGSKFLDSMLTGIVFSSSLVSSGRRTKTSVDDIVFPDKIYSNKSAKKIYEAASKENIETFNYLLSRDIKNDEASKILQYGIYGTGIINLPIESIVSLEREYQLEKDWMPEEAKLLLEKIKRKTIEFGVDWLLATREAAPRNAYPYPNIFKNPATSNMARELRKKIKLPEGTKMLSMETLATPDFLRRIRAFSKKINSVSKSPANIKKSWFNIILLRREILRDHNLALRFQILSSIPWRVWGEKKRHRTVPMVIESLYYCVGRAATILRNSEGKIRRGEFSDKMIKEIDDYFSVPPTVRKNPELLKRYLASAINSFNCYKKLLKMGIKPASAVFVIPRAVKLDILQSYDLYNLLTGYYPLRLCATAEEEMRRFSIKEANEIKKALKRKGLAIVADLIGPKCAGIGFCPEEKSCGYIKSKVKGYNDRFHKEMKEELEKRFEKNLSLIHKKI